MTTVKLSDITPDDRNANAHTERGTYMLRRSIERFGFLEPGVLDANNRIIGGNNRTEAAVDVLDASEAVVIDIDGTTAGICAPARSGLDDAGGKGGGDCAESDGASGD
jgi:ParB-like chromosome segregation protein Spo0J